MCGVGVMWLLPDAHQKFVITGMGTRMPARLPETPSQMHT